MPRKIFILAVKYFSPTHPTQSLIRFSWCHFRPFTQEIYASASNKKQTWETERVVGSLVVTSQVTGLHHRWQVYITGDSYTSQGTALHHRGQLYITGDSVTSSWSAVILSLPQATGVYSYGTRGDEYWLPIVTYCISLFSHWTNCFGDVKTMSVFICVSVLSLVNC